MRERGRGGHEAGLRRGKMANNGGKSGFLGPRLNQVSPHLRTIKLTQVDDWLVTCSPIDLLKQLKNHLRDGWKTPWTCQSKFLFRQVHHSMSENLYSEFTFMSNSSNIFWIRPTSPNCEISLFQPPTIWPPSTL